MDLFKIDPGLAIWTWISFGILFFLLSKFAFPSLMKNLKDRENMIADSVENAQRIEKQLSQIKKEHEEIIQRSKNEASEILRNSRKEAEQVRQTILEKADSEAKEYMEQAKLKIAEERVKAVQSIRSELTDFVCNTAEKVVDRAFIAREDKEWTRELVNKI